MAEAGMDSIGTVTKGGGLLANRLGPVATISIAQLFGTSLWFSANSVADNLMRAWHATAADIGWLTSAVQLGFILGTLGMSISGCADRFRASSIFVVSAIAGAASNACFAWLSDGLVSGALFRFLVGVSLAGIYPMGMKLIVSWAPDRAGAALAQLVAMLTLGTALPYAFRPISAGIAWQVVVVASSVLALLGASLIRILGDGPHLRYRAGAASRSAAADRPTVFSVFRLKAFRAATFGYFGHMWELYAFWTLVPLFVAQVPFVSKRGIAGVTAMSFCIIAVGALGCVVAGALSRRIGSARIAACALGLSGTCCLVFSLGWRELPAPVLVGLLIVWGASVVPDSPQFSALAARACPPELVGSALAIQTSIGFAITVVSITATTALFEHIGLDAAWLLVPGPVMGLLGFAPAFRRAAEAAS